MAVRRSALFVAVFAAAMLLAVAVASASYSTKVVVSLKTPAFHGSLKSARGACTTGRRVKLFREKAGPDRLLGADTSNSKGRWSIPAGRLRSGASYYAKAPAKGNCRAAKSKVLSIG